MGAANEQLVEGLMAHTTGIYEELGMLRAAKALATYFTEVVKSREYGPADLYIRLITCMHAEGRAYPSIQYLQEFVTHTRAVLFLLPPSERDTCTELLHEGVIDISRVLMSKEHEAIGMIAKMIDPAVALGPQDNPEAGPPDQSQPGNTFH
jgi:hypothetical protein